MDTLISNATGTFTATVGFAPSSVVSWVGTNLIMPVVGAGIDVLYELRYWIIALLVLGIFVYFSYRAYRFFRH